MNVLIQYERYGNQMRSTPIKLSHGALSLMSMSCASRAIGSIMGPSVSPTGPWGVLEPSRNATARAALALASAAVFEFDS